MKRDETFNLLFPEWQGYAMNQDVYHGAFHFCRHVTPETSFSQVSVPEVEELIEEDGIIGRRSLLRLLDRAAEVLLANDPNRIFTVGGTCACELAPVAFLNEKYDGDLALFWFDAHADLNTPATSPSHRLHGMPLRVLLGQGDSLILQRMKTALSPTQVALVGARDLDPEERSFVDTHRLPIFLPNARNAGDELIDFVKSRGLNRAYIHLDLDVTEPSEFPHVLVPAPNGLGLDILVNTLRSIRQKLDVVGCSIVEYCPRGEGGTNELRNLALEGLGLAV